MNKIKLVRKVTCKETRDRFSKEFDFVGLMVAEMVDGTRFYTQKGGTCILGTSENIDGFTDISDVHDFQTIDVPGGVQSEEDFIKIVERDAVLDEKDVEKFMSDEAIKEQYAGMKVKHFDLEHLATSEGWKGTFELEFPNADGIDYDTSMVNGFFVYDYKGEQIAWDKWMPDEQTHQLEGIIRKEIQERLKRQSAK